MKVLCLLILELSAVIGDPEVFEEYFDDSLKKVDVRQSIAINSCLSSGQSLNAKFEAALDQCLADPYIEDLVGIEDLDTDTDGLPDSSNRNEACFYRAMGWVNGADEVDAAAITADFGGLNATLKAEFDGNIG